LKRHKKNILRHFSAILEFVAKSSCYAFNNLPYKYLVVPWNEDVVCLFGISYNTWLDHPMNML